jgi:hypothetical protein
MPTPPPRIFVITARDSDVAVIFRRGPSDWFHLLKWDMANDTFEAGAGSKAVCILKNATCPQMEHCYCISFFRAPSSRRHTRMLGR